MTLDDDDEFDEDAIPSFSHPALAADSQPLNGQVDKGKGRALDQLAPPATNGVSGNIGSSAPEGQRGTRQTVGGIKVETRSAYGTYNTKNAL